MIPQPLHVQSRPILGHQLPFGPERVLQLLIEAPVAHPADEAERSVEVRPEFPIGS